MPIIVDSIIAFVGGYMGVMGLPSPLSLLVDLENSSSMFTNSSIFVNIPRLVIVPTHYAGFQAHIFQDNT